MAEAKVTPYTLPDGTEITLGRVSPMLSVTLQAAYPKPKPPVERVQITDEDWIEEENLADPAYLRALAERNEKLNNLFMQTVVELGAKLPFDEAELQRRLSAFNAIFVKLTDGALIDTSKPTYAYIFYVSGAGKDEIEDITSIILSRSAPKEEAIAAAVDTFQGNV